MPEWPKGHDWKSCVPQGTEVSNPSLSSTSGLKLLELLAHLVGVPRGLHAHPVVRDLALGIDDHRRPDHADGLFSVEHLLAPRAVLLHDGVRGIGEQADLQLVLRDELA